MKFGVQLFGVLADRPGQTLEVLEAMAKAGITCLEPCVSVEPIPGMEHVIWPASWLEENIGRLSEMGMEIPSAHLFAKELGSCVPVVKRLAEQTGLRQVVLKSPQELTDMSLQQAALRYRKLADELADSGVEVLLHNEGHDISTKIGGKTAYEHLLDLCQGKVFAQVDAGWVLFAGEDVKDFLWRNGPRVKSLHYKDYAAGATDPHDVTIGAGALDIKSCVAFARAWNVPQVLDQEHFDDPARELAAICETINSFKMNWEDTVSYVNTYDIETGEIKTLTRYDMPVESPNWLRGSDRMLLDGRGKLYYYYPETGETRLIDTGELGEFGNAHVPSPDEKWIGASCGMTDTQVYLLPIEGGEPRQVTQIGPSYFHGWSPDGKSLLYLGLREDAPDALDIYRAPVGGGEEARLTHGGYNDGPEYSPDGQYIWYNSNCSGSAQIWRMKADGSEAVQMTVDNGRNNMFPHISPDGHRVVYTSYPTGCLEDTEHLPDVPVEIWMMNADGSDPHRILSLLGGHGVMHVNTWAEDSRRFAFVSYELKR